MGRSSLPPHVQSIVGAIYVDAVICRHARRVSGSGRPHSTPDRRRPARGRAIGQRAGRGRRHRSAWCFAAAGDPAGRRFRNRPARRPAQALRPAPGAVPGAFRVCYRVPCDLGGASRQVWRRARAATQEQEHQGEKQMIRPCIVYADHCNEALEFYVSIFPNSKVLSIQRAEADNGPVTKGQVLGATFQLDGREYLAFDGGPTFKFTEGFSLMVTCKDQAEVDKYWNTLTTNGGEGRPFGWGQERLRVSGEVGPRGFAPMVGRFGGRRSRTALGGMLQNVEMVH